MSTRCNVIIKDESTTLYFYRHSDGYPDCAGKQLAEFVLGYTDGSMRRDAMQSAGWLIILGHQEYLDGEFTGKPRPDDRFSGWKCGAYEPTTSLHGDIEYCYTIDLMERTLKAQKASGELLGRTLSTVSF